MTTKGQVVIPREIRDAMGLRPGTRLRVETNGDVITLRRMTKEAFAEWYARLAGTLAHGDPVSDLEAEHRREIETDARRRL